MQIQTYQIPCHPGQIHLFASTEVQQRHVTRLVISHYWPEWTSFHDQESRRSTYKRKSSLLFLSMVTNPSGTMTWQVAYSLLSWHWRHISVSLWKSNTSNIHRSLAEYQESWVSSVSWNDRTDIRKCHNFLDKDGVCISIPSHKESYQVQTCQFLLKVHLCETLVIANAFFFKLPVIFKRYHNKPFKEISASCNLIYHHLPLQI